MRSYSMGLELPYFYGDCKSPDRGILRVCIKITHQGHSMFQEGYFRICKETVKKGRGLFENCVLFRLFYLFASFIEVVFKQSALNSAVKQLEAPLRLQAYLLGE